jgi:hypothetical protein
MFAMWHRREAEAGTQDARSPRDRFLLVYSRLDSNPCRQRLGALDLAPLFFDVPELAIDARLPVDG